MIIQSERFCKSQIKMQKKVLHIFYCAKLFNKTKYHVDELTIKSFTHIKVKIIIFDDYIHDV